MLFVIPPGTRPEPTGRLELLPFTVRTAAGADVAISSATGTDLILLDGRDDLLWAKGACQSIRAAEVAVPVLMLLKDAALPIIASDWGFTDFILASAQPAEWDARVRLAIAAEDAQHLIRGGPIEIDEAAYAVTLEGRPLDLTYTEFELLKYLVLNPGRVLSREHLLSEVWGYDYYGGTRTVDVHIRRLRAKLGVHDGRISTVRNVGYRFTSR